MKRVRITFDYDDYMVMASGTVWDSLYVNNLDYNIKDEHGESVSLTREEYNVIRELAEELIIEKYNDTELYFS